MAAVAIFGLFYGALTVVLALLNRRDRRDAALRTTIAACLPREVRGLVAVSVAVSAWRARAHVTLDMRECAADQTWRVIAELGPALPGGTVLSVLVRAAVAECETSVRVVAPRTSARRRIATLGAPAVTARGA